MKRSSKPLIIIVASILVLTTFMILVAQGLRLKYEELQRESAQLENQIKAEKNQSVKYKANFQMLTTEDFIKKYAAMELGLIEDDRAGDQKIYLSKEEIVNLSKDVEKRNE